MNQKARWRHLVAKLHVSSIGRTLQGRTMLGRYMYCIRTSPSFPTFLFLSDSLTTAEDIWNALCHFAKPLSQRNWKFILSHLISRQGSWNLTHSQCSPLLPKRNSLRGLVVVGRQDWLASIFYFFSHSHNIHLRGNMAVDLFNWFSDLYFDSKNYCLQEWEVIFSFPKKSIFKWVKGIPQSDCSPHRVWIYVLAVQLPGTCCCF